MADNEHDRPAKSEQNRWQGIKSVTVTRNKNRLLIQYGLEEIIVIVQLSEHAQSDAQVHNQWIKRAHARKHFKRVLTNFSLYVALY